MKAKPYQIAALKNAILNEYKAVLIFGTDSGVIKNTEKEILTLLSPKDWNFIKITPQQIKENKSILADEGNALSLMGGKKVLLAQDVTASAIEAVEIYLNQLKTDSILVLVAENLQKNADLRVLCEQAGDVLTFACYAQDPETTYRFIASELSAKGYSVENGVVKSIYARTNGVSQILLSELDKLVTYAGSNKTITMAMIKAILCDDADSSIEELALAVLGGNSGFVEKKYPVLLAQGENPVTVVRAMSNLFTKLLTAFCVYEKEKNMTVALKKIMSPAQFRLEEFFSTQIRCWKKEHIIRVLELLNKTEKDIKTTALPAETVLSRTLTTVTTAAKRQQS